EQQGRPQSESQKTTWHVWPSTKSGWRRKRTEQKRRAPRPGRPPQQACLLWPTRHSQRGPQTAGGPVQGLLVMTSTTSGERRACHDAASIPSAMGRTDPSRNTKLVIPSWKLLKPQAYVQRCPLVVLGAQVP